MMRVWEKSLNWPVASESRLRESLVMMEMKSASEFLVLLSKITGAEIKYPCPGCGYLVFDEPPGSYEICPICFGEDDLAQLRFH